MKKFLFLNFLTILFFSCKTKINLIKQSEGYIPEKELLTGVYFGMPLTEFLKITEPTSISIIDSTSQTFRLVYAVNLGETEPKTVVYYFDSEGTKPLYEIILIYESPEKAIEKGVELLGPQNYQDNKEWYIKRDKGFDLLAWNHKTKFIITALLPKTEWYEEFHLHGKVE